MGLTVEELQGLVDSGLAAIEQLHRLVPLSQTERDGLELPFLQNKLLLLPSPITQAIDKRNITTTESSLLLAMKVLPRKIVDLLSPKLSAHNILLVKDPDNQTETLLQIIESLIRDKNKAYLDQLTALSESDAYRAKRRIILQKIDSLRANPITLIPFSEYQRLLNKPTDAEVHFYETIGDTMASELENLITEFRALAQPASNADQALMDLCKQHQDDVVLKPLYEQLQANQNSLNAIIADTECKIRLWYTPDNTGYIDRLEAHLQTNLAADQSNSIPNLMSKQTVLLASVRSRLDLIHPEFLPIEDLKKRLDEVHQSLQDLLSVEFLKILSLLRIHPTPENSSCQQEINKWIETTFNALVAKNSPYAEQSKNLNEVKKLLMQHLKQISASKVSVDSAAVCDRVSLCQQSWYNIGCPVNGTDSILLLQQIASIHNLKSISEQRSAASMVNQVQSANYDFEKKQTMADLTKEIQHLQKIKFTVVEEKSRQIQTLLDYINSNLTLFTHKKDSNIQRHQRRLLEYQKSISDITQRVEYDPKMQFNSDPEIASLEKQRACLTAQIQALNRVSDDLNENILKFEQDYVLDCKADLANLIRQTKTISDHVMKHFPLFLAPKLDNKWSKLNTIWTQGGTLRPVKHYHDQLSQARSDYDSWYTNFQGQLKEYLTELTNKLGASIVPTAERLNKKTYENSPKNPFTNNRIAITAELSNMLGACRQTIARNGSPNYFEWVADVKTSIDLINNQLSDYNRTVREETVIQNRLDSKLWEISVELINKLDDLIKTTTPPNESSRLLKVLREHIHLINQDYINLDHSKLDEMNFHRQVTDCINQFLKQEMHKLSEEERPTWIQWIRVNLLKPLIDFALNSWNEHHFFTAPFAGKTEKCCSAILNTTREILVAQGA